MMFLDWTALPPVDLLAPLGRQLFYAAIVFAIIAPIAWLLRRHSPALRIALFGLVLIRLILPVDLASPISARAGLEAALAGGSETAILTVQPMERLETARTTTTESIRTASDEIADLGTPWNEATLSPGVLGPMKATVVEGPGAWFDRRLGTQLLMVLWASISTALLSLLLLRRRACHREIARALELTEGPIRNRVEAWRTRLQVDRPVRVVASEGTRTPFTVGLRRPTIFMPESLIHQATPEMLDGIIGHEMAHIRRFDDLWLGLCRIIECLYFFYPIAWICSRKINSECEQLCDSMVLRADHEIAARSYASSLLAVMKMNLHGGQVTMAFGNITLGKRALGKITLGNPKKVLKTRIRHILDGQRTRPGSRLGVGLVLALGLLLLPLANIVEGTPAPPEPPQAPAPLLTKAPAVPPAPPAPEVPVRPEVVASVQSAPTVPEVPPRPDAPALAPPAPERPAMKPPVPPEFLLDPAVAPAPTVALTTRTLPARAPEISAARAPEISTVRAPRPAVPAPAVPQPAEPTATAPPAPPATSTAPAIPAPATSPAPAESRYRQSGISAPFVLVTHGDTPIDTINRYELQRIYTGKAKKKKKKGLVWVPIEQPAQSMVRQNFSRLVLRKEVNKIVQQWEKLESSGKGTRPQELGDENELLRFIAGNPGAIGYVSAATPIPRNVKILQLELQTNTSPGPRLPTDRLERSPGDKAEEDFEPGIRDAGGNGLLEQRPSS